MDTIIDQIKSACVEVSRILQNHIPTSTKTTMFNKSGDNQDTMDLLTNGIFKNFLGQCGNVYAIASEEDTKITYLNQRGEYFVVFDPLDGSSNINVNISLGSIFGIFKLNGKKISKLTGRDMVCSGYCLYSQSTLLMVCTDKPRLYILRKNWFDEIAAISMPDKGKVYAINSGNRYRWDNKITRLVCTLIDEGRSCRWCACMVGDIHRILLEGGIFMYPRDKKNSHGKLRLVYEGYPMAHIVEKAGGMASDGSQLILDIPFPLNIHQKIPMIFCGKYEASLLS